MNEIKELLESLKTNKDSGRIVEEEDLIESFTIRKSDLEKFGKKLIKKIDNFLHDEYILTFPKLKIDQETFDNLINKVKEKYESGNLNCKDIFDILFCINLDCEIDGDLFCEKEGYLDLFRVLFVSYTYLKD